MKKLQTIFIVCLILCSAGSSILFFARADDNPPVITNEYPPNGSDDIPVSPLVGINISSENMRAMDISWFTNSSGSWNNFAFTPDVVDGRFFQNIPGAIQQNTEYFWGVNVSENNLSFLDGFDDNSLCVDVYTSDGFVFTANRDDGLFAFIVNEGVLSFVGHVDDGGIYKGVYYHGGYVFAARENEGVTVYSFDGTDFTFIDNEPDGFDCTEIWSDGTHIFSACRDDGIRAYGFNGTDIFLLDHYPTTSYCYGLCGDNQGHIFVADYANGIQAFGFNGTVFTHIATRYDPGLGLYGYYVGVYYYGGYVFAACENNGIRAYSFNGTDFTLVDERYDGTSLDGQYYYYKIHGDNQGHIFAASYMDGIHVYGFNENLQCLSYLGAIDHGGNHLDVMVDDTKVFCAAYDHGLHMYGFDCFTSTEELFSFTTTNSMIQGILPPETDGFCLETLSFEDLDVVWLETGDTGWTGDDVPCVALSNGYTNITLSSYQLFIPDELVDAGFLQYRLEEWWGGQAARLQYNLQYSPDYIYPTGDLNSLLGNDPPMGDIDIGDAVDWTYYPPLVYYYVDDVVLFEDTYYLCVQTTHNVYTPQSYPTAWQEIIPGTGSSFPQNYFQTGACETQGYYDADLLRAFNITDLTDHETGFDVFWTINVTSSEDALNIFYDLWYQNSTHTMHVHRFNDSYSTPSPPESDTISFWSTNDSMFLDAAVQRDSSSVLFTARDGVTNLSVSLDNGFPSGWRVENTTLIQNYSSGRCYYYPVLVNESGGLEFLLEIFETPGSNEIVFNLSYPGLEVEYQSNGNIQFIKRHIPPSNSFGSGTITERLFTIYQPLIVDSANNSVYAECVVEDDKLYLSIPQSFLDTAVYPIFVDPTFGYTGSTSSTYIFYSTFGREYYYGVPVTAPENGVLHNITAGFAVVSGSNNYQGALYEYIDVNTDYAGDLIAVTESNAVTSVGETTFEFSEPYPELISGTSYYLLVAVAGAGSGSSERIYKENSAGLSIYDYDGGGIDFDSLDPLTGERTTGDRAYIYGTYSEGGGPSNSAPSYSNPSPVNESSGVSIGTLLSIDVSDADGDSMNLTWLSNSSGSWTAFGFNYSGNNGTYYMNNSNFSSYDTTYYWYVNITDGTDYNNTPIYHFTTESAPAANNAPTVSAAYPINNSNDISVNINHHNITISDPDGDNMNYTYQYFIEGCGLTGSSGESKTNGTYTLVLNDGACCPLEYNTTYSWWVNVTDDETYTNETFYFTTQWINLIPTQHTPYPCNGSTNIPIQPTLGVSFNDSNLNQTFTITFQSNYSGSWTTYQVNNSVSNPGTANWTFTGASEHSTKYWWRVYCDDGLANISQIYYFTTAAVVPDGNPPSITINYAGNLSDNGGPYWRPPGESTALSGIFSDGYYTNMSMQSEDWIYINCTITDDNTVETVYLQWLNDTTWTNDIYTLTNTVGDYWEINTSGIIPTSQGHWYSFNIKAIDNTTEYNVATWSKTGIDANTVRRKIQLNCTPSNISYTPFYLYNTSNWTQEYSGINKADRLNHDQGVDGTIHDSGVLNTTLQTDELEERWCATYTGYSIDDTVCSQFLPLNNIYYHVWTSQGEKNNDIYMEFWTTKRYLTVDYDNTRPYRENWVVTNISQNKSQIYFNNSYYGAQYSPDYYLLSGTIDTTNTSINFTDNSIYEIYFIIFSRDYVDPVGDNHYIATISNKSFNSFVLFNVPDNETLNTSYSDSDSDGLSDWTELYTYYTNPFIADTDNDGVSDYNETLSGSDPNNYTDTIPYTPTAINAAISPPTWNIGNIDMGLAALNNFTFYQNGTSNIDITITVNSTNYSFVTYADWLSLGHDRFYVNFTNDSWVSENNIIPGSPATTVLETNFAPGNFSLGLRLMTPRTTTYTNRREDFTIVLTVSEST